MTSHHAHRQRQIDACRTRAIEMMKSSHGQEAADGGYYTLMFDWLYRQLESGRTPKGIPARLLEGWRQSTSPPSKTTGV